MALSDAEIRDQIFALRGGNPPLSFQKIADQLGISVGKVHRLFKQPAKPTAQPAPMLQAHPGGDGSDVDDDTDVRERLKSLRMKEIQLKESNIDRQLALMDGKAGSGDATMAMMVMQEMRSIREDVDRKLSGSKPQDDPMAAMIKGMKMLADVKEQVSVLAPPPALPAAPTAADLELRLLLEKMNLERDAANAARAAELERSNRLWGMLESNLPWILEGGKTFLSNMAKQQQALPPQPPVLQVLPGGQTEVVQPAQPGEIAMTCVSCKSKAMVRPEPGEIPVCPVCGGALQPDIGPAPPPKAPWPEEATFG